MIIITAVAWKSDESHRLDQRYLSSSYSSYFCGSDGIVYQNILVARYSNPSVREIFICNSAIPLECCRTECITQANGLSLKKGSRHQHSHKKKGVRRVFRLLKEGAPVSAPEVSLPNTSATLVPPPSPPSLPSLPSLPAVQRESQTPITPKTDNLPLQPQNLHPVEQPHVANKPLMGIRVGPIISQELTNQVPSNLSKASLTEPQDPNLKRSTEDNTELANGKSARHREHHKNRPENVNSQKPVDPLVTSLAGNFSQPPASVATKDSVSKEKMSKDQLIEKIIRLIIIPKLARRESLGKRPDSLEKPTGTKRLETDVKKELQSLFYELDQQRKNSQSQILVNQQENTVVIKDAQPQEPHRVSPSPIAHHPQAHHKDTTKLAGSSEPVPAAQNA